MTLKLSRLPLCLGFVACLAAIGCDSDDEDTGSSDTDAGTKAGSGGKGGSGGPTGRGGSGSASGSGGSSPSGQTGGSGGTGGTSSGGAGGAGGAGGTTEDESGPLKGPFVISTSASAGDDSVGYINFVDSLENQTLDFKDAREFSGQSDLWVLGSDYLVADDETLSITKYKRAGNTLGDELGSVNFSNTGVTSVGFWLSYFVSNTKAYLFNGVSEAIVWDPSALEIGKTIALGSFPDKGDNKAGPGFADRAAVLRDGLLYEPIYWASDNYFNYDKTTAIVVIDTEKDELVATLEAPCPGLDFATQDEDGTIYWSSWIFAPPGAAVLDQPTSCVVKLAPGKDSKPELAFNVKDKTDGREGGALRYVGNGKGILSVFHLDHAPEADRKEIETVAYGANWRFWNYDFKTGKATQNDDIDWNAGAAYGAEAGGKKFMLVPGDGYGETKFYPLGSDLALKPVLTSKGWSLRLFDAK